MSRTTGDIDIDNEILTRLQSENFRSRVEIDYWNGSTFVYEDSVSGDEAINWTDSVKKRKYLNFGTQPVANTVNFTIENRDGRFSPGSGEAEDDRYQIDTKIRLRHIYPMEKEFLADKDDNILTDKDGRWLEYQQREYTLYQSVFHIDEPVYNANGTNIDTVKIKGRDAYKYALEKKINIDALSNTAITQFIKDICDQVGILYDSDSITDLSAFTGRTLADGYDEEKTADSIFEDIMAIINQDGSVGYQMYLEYDDTLKDNILYVQPLPSLYEADFAFNDNGIMSMASFKKDRSRFLQRMTVLTDSAVPNEREPLGSDTLTDETKAIPLSKSSLYRTYSVAGSGIVTLDSMSESSFTFTVVGTATITIHGVGYDSFPSIAGEYIDNDNMIANIGQTSTFTSKLILDDTEANSIAKGLITKFGDPDKEAQGIVYPYCNTLLITNDMVFPFIRNIFETDLYYIVGIKHSWSFTRESTSFDLQDSGLNWDDVYDGFIYDSGLYRTPGTTGQEAVDLIYDIGLVYDMDFGPNALADDIITTTRSEYIYDVGEA